VDLIVSTVELKGYEKPVLYIENIFDDSLIENVNKAFYEKEERLKLNFGSLLTLAKVKLFVSIGITLMFDKAILFLAKSIIPADN
ncbi:hypothetical protein ACTPD5_21220, partial [Clostridioides difficile]|uniref:hypothetical protein n=1 Tax=Clostridioides difficile TaxID=1496 RepID=UPI003F8D8950